MLLNQYKNMLTAYRPLNGKIQGSGQVLVRGCNGSGKTLLLLALLGKHEYTGSIRVGNVEVRDLSSDVIERSISVMPQDPIALPGTFKDNLSLTQYTNPQLDLKPVKKTLTGILDKLDLLHLTGSAGEGYNNLVSDMRLSPGQIALMNLARCAIDVVLKKTRIVVIDDLFSKLDWEYTAMAKEFINRAFKACIVIVAESTSDQRLSVRGFTPLDEAYPNPNVFNPLYLAAVDKDVRSYHRALRDAVVPFREPIMPELVSISGPPPHSNPHPPDRNDPLFTPKRPAPRPPPPKEPKRHPVMLKATESMPNTPEPVILATSMMYEPIEDEDQADREGLGLEEFFQEASTGNTINVNDLVGTDDNLPNQNVVAPAADDAEVDADNVGPFPGAYPDNEDCQMGTAVELFCPFALRIYTAFMMFMSMVFIVAIFPLFVLFA